MNSITLQLKKIAAPLRLSHEGQERKQNYHIPSFKNSKRIIQARGRMKRAMLITSPEFQDWMERAVQSLESQLLSMCQIGSGEILQGHSKLSAMLSLLPADDSVNDLREGSWKVNRVEPGEEGATITLERL